jgi:hypothetical protein
MTNDTQQLKSLLAKARDSLEESSPSEEDGDKLLRAIDALATLLERYEAEAEAVSARVEDISTLFNGAEWTPDRLNEVADRLRRHCGK